MGIETEDARRKAHLCQDGDSTLTFLIIAVHHSDAHLYVIPNECTDVVQKGC